MNPVYQLLQFMHIVDRQRVEIPKDFHMNPVYQLRVLQQKTTIWIGLTGTQDTIDIRCPNNCQIFWIVYIIFHMSQTMSDLLSESRLLENGSVIAKMGGLSSVAVSSIHF